MGIIKLKPAFKDYLWGGNALRTMYGKETEITPLAESWELSTHPDGQSVVADGHFAGLSFGDYLSKLGRAAWGTDCADFDRFPVLIKLIDAAQPLSVQVHPDDAYALKNEGEYGKTEVWYVLDCDPGASLYFGMKRDVTKEEFMEAVRKETFCSLLNEVPVKKGDVFFIQAGTVHAIGAGIRICEIQQNSNTTYRVYDYGRRDAAGNLRELHVEKAAQVSRLSPSKQAYIGGAAEEIAPGVRERRLAACKYFAAVRLDIEKEYRIDVTDKSFVSLLIIEGSGTVFCGAESVAFHVGDSLFLPAASGEARIEGACALIHTTV
ncbi:MAG: type I phosphomannose isomerase catalytic subunit [Christensenella sp.]|nr:type I phosphomannose isomerase catalytic subunit [Christensenella sp.]